jgi:protein TonB
MLITKFDLYNAEWLDLVFDHRNKNYGAYELRLTYGNTMVKSMSIAFAAIATLALASIIFKPKPVPLLHETVVNIMPPPPVEPLEPKKVVEPVKPAEIEPAKPAAPTQMTRFVQMRPSEDPAAIDPPVTTDIKGPIGPQDVKGPETNVDNIIESKPDGQGGGLPGAGVDVSVYTLVNLEVMPEPDGGAAGWAKFLQKNLRFPGAAQDAGVSGKVILSFIIEKDGKLTNITVDRPAGYGFDEEATRVLKLAKAWKPGIQNGQKVRVKYSIPISFQLATEE